MSSLLVSGQLPDLAKETPVWLAAGEASSKAAVTAGHPGCARRSTRWLTADLCRAQTVAGLLLRLDGRNDQTKGPDDPDNEADTSASP
jgi:hypothetical protein